MHTSVRFVQHPCVVSKMFKLFCSSSIKALTNSGKRLPVSVSCLREYVKNEIYCSANNVSDHA
jgi:hypothetical protein